MKPGPVTPSAGRQRPVSLDQLGDLPDPAPLPNEFDAEELSRSHLTFAAGAHAALVGILDALPLVDKECLLHVLFPGEASLRERAAVAGVSAGTIRNKALRYRQALRDALHTTATGNPLKQGDSGDDTDFR